MHKRPSFWKLHISVCQQPRAAELSMSLDMQCRVGRNSGWAELCPVPERHLQPDGLRRLPPVRPYLAVIRPGLRNLHGRPRVRPQHHRLLLCGLHGLRSTSDEYLHGSGQWHVLRPERRLLHPALRLRVRHRSVQRGLRRHQPGHMRSMLNSGCHAGLLLRAKFLRISALRVLAMRPRHIPHGLRGIRGTARHLRELRLSASQCLLG